MADELDVDDSFGLRFECVRLETGFGLALCTDTVEWDFYGFGNVWLRLMVCC